MSSKLYYLVEENLWNQLERMIDVVGMMSQLVADSSSNGPGLVIKHEELGALLDMVGDTFQPLRQLPYKMLEPDEITLASA